MVGRFLKVSVFFTAQRYIETGLGNHAALFTGIKAGRLVCSKAVGLTAIGWIGLILSVGVTLGIVPLLAFYAGLSANQRRHILQRIRMVVAIAPD